MLEKVLIANRGEIACRIARTARKMGIATVAVFSDADASALHVSECDEAVHIGPSPAPDSYLRIDKIIAAAKSTGADCIHPGYGFLSENPDLPDACVAAGIAFVGPASAAMRALGGKAAAKEIAIKAGVPVVPGYQGERQDAAVLAKEAAKIGYPVMIKAVAGGGGRGMRLVERAAQMTELLESARREAEQAFGNPAVLIEKVVQRPRHIEVQVFGDAHGNVVHMFERDCTLQRRHQKVIEEAPAPSMTPALRTKICNAAVMLAKSVGYTGAGTVEFLVEGGALDETARWYFIEMNTRLQVEHPVTEAITGLDLVEWQFRVAAGETLPLQQEQISMHGHAVEARVCAEDPAKGFLPSIGTIEAFEVPKKQGLRVETGVRAGSEVSPYYDSMIAKLIVHRPDRDDALSALSDVLAGSAIPGPQTNQSFLARLLDDAHVRQADMDTGLIARELDGLVTPPRPTGFAAKLARLWIDHSRTAFGDGTNARWSAGDGFQLGPLRRHSLALMLDGAPVEWMVEFGRDGSIGVDGESDRTSGGAHSWSAFPSSQDEIRVVVDGYQFTVAKPVYALDGSDDGNGAATGHVRIPINGRVAKIFVATGATVEKGDKIAIVEAMKMEHVVVAPISGTIESISVAEGAQAKQGALLAHIAA